MRRIPLRARDGSVRAYALVDDEDYEWLMQRRWHLRDGYAVSTLHLDQGRRTTLGMHAEIVGSPGVDHKDRNPLNNQRSNLRPATQLQNGQNVTLSVRSTSGERGVTRVRGGKWIARVMVAGRSHHLGTYCTVAEAARVVRAYRAEHLPYSPEAP